MNVAEIAAFGFSALIFLSLAIRFIRAVYTPERWHVYPVCLFLGHRWSESYRPESESYQPKLKTCQRCGIDRRANPPAPLVP